MFQNALRSVSCERPPRPRLFGTGPFFGGAATPPSQGGEYARLVICSQRYPAVIDAATAPLVYKNQRRRITEEDSGKSSSNQHIAGRETGFLHCSIQSIRHNLIRGDKVHG